MRTLQQEIISALGVKPAIDPWEEIKERSKSLALYLIGSGHKGFVLGISGGQDSLLAGMLAQRAVDILLESGIDAAFHAVRLPYGTQADEADAVLALDTIKPNHRHYVNIKSSVDALAESLSNSGNDVSDYGKGNIKARIRMTTQYAIAGRHKLLVIGTDHAAEAVTGFFTKFGDGGADILPLSGLTKRQGRAMLRCLGVPEVFTTKAPTADLLDGHPGQADESELGLTYKQLDKYLEGEDVDDEVAEAIEARYLATQHKRSLPVSLVTNG